MAIRDSYNVSSITDNGTGNYTINFTTAMDNANYVCLAAAAVEFSNIRVVSFYTYATTNVSLIVQNPSPTNVDDPIITIAVFGGKN